MKWVKGVWRSGLWGLASLLAVNTAGAFTGVTLGYSWLCLAASFLLGLPGVTALVLLDMLMK